MPTRLLKFFTCQCHDVMGHSKIPAMTKNLTAIHPGEAATVSITRHMSHHYNLAVLTGIVAATAASALLMLLHETKNPEVSFAHHTNTEPWNRYDRKQYKLWSAGRDYSSLDSVPKY